MCAVKFKNTICRPIGAQFMSDDLIALFEFELQRGEVRTTLERHYRLVPSDALTVADLEAYQRRSL